MSDRSEYYKQWKEKKLSENPEGFRAKQKTAREKTKAKDPDKQREYFKLRARKRRADPVKGKATKEYRKKWSEENRDKINATRQKWRETRTPEQIAKDNAYHRRVREEHPEKTKQWMDNWRKSNPEKVASYNEANHETKKRQSREYNKTNRPKIQARAKDLYANDPNYAIKIRLSARMRGALKRARAKKSAKFIELIGCTEAQLMSHIESLFVDGMSWENRAEWHLDHIMPCARFDLTQPEEQVRCFHYTNLQPLWGVDNMKKGAS